MHPVNEQCFRYFAEIVRTLKATTHYERVLSLIVDRIVRSFNCQTCAIALIDPKSEYLRIDQCYNLSLTFCNSFRRRIATSSIGQLLWTGKPIVIPDSTRDPALAEEIALEHPFGSCICLQISVDQQTLGYLHVDCAEPGVLGLADVEMLPYIFPYLILVQIEGLWEVIWVVANNRYDGFAIRGPLCEGCHDLGGREDCTHWGLCEIDLDKLILIGEKSYPL